MKRAMTCVALVGFSVGSVFAAPSQESSEDALGGGFSIAVGMARQSPARLMAASLQGAPAAPDPTALERVILMKNRMMEIATSKPYEVRGRGEKAYGVTTHWAWQSYAAKQNEFLLRRLDFVRELVAYAKTEQPNPEIMAVIHWARETKFAVMNHPEGRDYSDNSISAFLKDAEFAALPAAFRK